MPLNVAPAPIYTTSTLVLQAPQGQAGQLSSVQLVNISPYLLSLQSGPFEGYQMPWSVLSVPVQGSGASIMLNVINPDVTVPAGLTPAVASTWYYNNEGPNGSLNPPSSASASASSSSGGGSSMSYPPSSQPVQINETVPVDIVSTVALPPSYPIMFGGENAGYGDAAIEVPLATPSSSHPNVLFAGFSLRSLSSGLTTAEVDFVVLSNAQTLSTPNEEYCRIPINITSGSGWAYTEPQFFPLPFLVSTYSSSLHLYAIVVASSSVQFQLTGFSFAQ